VDTKFYFRVIGDEPEPAALLRMTIDHDNGTLVEEAWSADNLSWGQAAPVLLNAVLDGDPTLDEVTGDEAARWFPDAVADQTDPTSEAVASLAASLGREMFGGPGSGPRPGYKRDGSSAVVHDSTDRMLDALRVAEGGFTIHSETGEQPTTGYAVAVRGHSSITPVDEFFSGEPGNEVGLQVLKDYVRREKAVLSEPGMHVGGWHDSENGEIVLDPSKVIMDLDEARAFSAAGNQQGFVDLAAIHRGDMDNAFIATGGTGDRETGGKM